MNNVEMFKAAIRYAGLVLLVFSLGACVSTAKISDHKPINIGVPVPEREVEILPKPDNPSYVHNAAIHHLIAKATTLTQQERYDSAIQEVERGLSIAPNNPFLWQKLAEVRLHQGRYWQAEQLANKSNALGRGDNNLLTKNEQIISNSQKARQAQ